MVLVPLYQRRGVGQMSLKLRIPNGNCDSSPKNKDQMNASQEIYAYADPEEIPLDLIRRRRLRLADRRVVELDDQGRRNMEERTSPRDIDFFAPLSGIPVTDFNLVTPKTGIFNPDFITLPDGRARTWKYISLITLVVQNAALALSMRYSRVREGDLYLSSTAVLCAEIIKFFICLYVVFVENDKNVDRWMNDLKLTIVDNFSDTLKVCVPSFVYVLQNNLLYVAASHLDAATYQVTYQLKILTTAVFSIFMLRRKLIVTQWTALLILVCGVVLVQLVQPEHHAAKASDADQHRITGFAAAIGACCLSGFAGVYFEKILKGSAISVWMRNVQLSLCSVPFALVACVFYDFSAISEKGFFFGYDLYIWYLVILQATGGLLVAMVVKYADNILKGFATSLAIVVACVASMLFFDFQLSVQFSFGTLLVISSIFMYGYQPPPKPSGVISPV